MKLAIVNGGKPILDFEIPKSLRVLEPTDTIPSQCDVIRIINQQDGDKRIVWDSFNLAEISDAKDMFNKLIAEGFVPYHVDPSGQKSPQVMHQFDPTAEEIIMSDSHRPEKSALRERREIVMAPQRMLAGG